MCGGHKPPEENPAYNSTGWYTVDLDRNMSPDLIADLPGGYSDGGDPRTLQYLKDREFSMVFNEFCGPSDKELLGFVASILKPGGIYYSPFYFSVTDKDLIDAGFTEVIYVPLIGPDRYWIKEEGLTLEGAIRKARERAVARPEKEKQKRFGFLAIKAVTSGHHR